MKRLLALALVLVIFSCWTFAEAVPPADTDKPVDKYPNGLPKYMTPEEEGLPIDRPTRGDHESREPPTGSIYCPPEYDPCEGLFFAWHSYTGLITEMVVPMTIHNPPYTAFVVVDNSSVQSSADSTLSGAGADMNHVEFIIRPTNTVWIRDYGPRFIFEDGNRAIIDHTYNRPRYDDNALNDYISTLWGVPHYDIPLEHGGGNFHLFANGDAFMSSLITQENPALSEQDVKDLYAEYQNLDLTIYTGFPTTFDSTRHIDMWMIPLADDKIIIGEYDSSTGQPYTITENAVTDLVSRGYTVYRTPGWRSGAHYTYTNAVILNDLVFVPTYSGYTTENAQALAAFQTAMPDHTMIQVNCSSIIGAAGAIHCIVMHVPSPDIPLTFGFPDGLPTLLPPDVPTTITVEILPGTEEILPGSNLLYYRFDGGAFETDPLVPLGGDLYQATLPGTDCDTSPEFYFGVEGSASGVVYEPPDAPSSFFTADVGTTVVIMDDDFETDLGWTVEDDPSLTSGTWERVDPVWDADRGAPPEDYDGSGFCYVTEDAWHVDVDGGPTRLISPSFDLGDASNPILRFAYWWSSDDQDGDPFDIDMSNDDGASWIPVLTFVDIGYPIESWSVQDIEIAAAIDPAPLTSVMKVRFSATDPGLSIAEGAIDAVEIFEVTCGSVECATIGDMTGEGDVNGNDVNDFVDCYLYGDPGTADCVCADIDGGGFGTSDVEAFVICLMAGGCP